MNFQGVSKGSSTLPLPSTAVVSQADHTVEVVPESTGTELAETSFEPDLSDPVVQALRGGSLQSDPVRYAESIKQCQDVSAELFEALRNGHSKKVHPLVLKLLPLLKVVLERAPVATGFEKIVAQVLARAYDLHQGQLQLSGSDHFQRTAKGMGSISAALHAANLLAQGKDEGQVLQEQLDNALTHNFDWSMKGIGASKSSRLTRLSKSKLPQFQATLHLSIIVARLEMVASDLKQRGLLDEAMTVDAAAAVFAKARDQAAAGKTKKINATELHTVRTGPWVLLERLS